MRRGLTLIELALVVAVAGIVMAMGVSGARRLLDGMSVRAATGEAHTLFGAARQLAILHGRRVTLQIDTAGSRLVVVSAADTLRVRQLGEVHGVRIMATRLATTYEANGLGHGASNLTMVITRGRAADTLTISRLGRVRRR